MTLDKQELWQYILNNRKTYTRQIKCNHLELYNHIMEMCPSNRFAENVWLYYHDMTNKPTCNCGVDLRFKGVFAGYSTTCNSCYTINRKINSKASVAIRNQPKTPPLCDNPNCNNNVVKQQDNTWGKHCSYICRGQHNSSKSRQKSANTCMQKYGVKHHRQTSENLAKFNKTILERYGTTNLMHVDKFKEQLIQTNLHKYGVECVFQSDMIKDKIKATNLKKYGVENPSQNAEVHKKKFKKGYKYVTKSGAVHTLQGFEPIVIDRLLQTYSEFDINFNPSAIPYILDGKEHVYIPDFELCGTTCEVKSYYTFFADYEKNVAKLLACSNVHLFVVDDNKKECFVFSIDDNWRRLYNSGQYDIFKKDANGQVCDFKCTLTDMYIKYNYTPLNTELIAGSTRHNTRYEDAIIIESSSYKLNRVAYDNMIMHKLNKIVRHTVYARNTTVGLVSANIANEFADINHIQGYTASTYYGLYYCDKLVAVAGFSKQRHGVGIASGKIELTRYCTSHNVPGGCGKLVKYAINLYKQDIISYSDNLISAGNMYLKIGFKLNNTVPPRYRYIKNGTDICEHRYKFAKHKLKNVNNYSADKSEAMIMRENGYSRVYDAGKRTWVMEYNVSN